MCLSVPQLTHGLGQGRKCKVSPWQTGSEGAVTVPGLFRAGIAQEKKNCQNDFPHCRAQCSSGYHPWTALGLSCWEKVCVNFPGGNKMQGKAEMKCEAALQK